MIDADDNPRSGFGKEIVMAERDAARLQARIDAGERIESAEEMTEDYRQNLIHLMTMQADSELAGGYGYVPWITRAPGVEEKHVVAQIVKDELRHATVMYGLLADLGVDVDSHVQAHDEAFTMRVAADVDIGTARITADKRVNILLPDRHLGRLRVLQFLHGSRRGAPARGRARVLLWALGAGDRGHL